MQIHKEEQGHYKCTRHEKEKLRFSEIFAKVCEKDCLLCHMIEVKGWVKNWLSNCKNHYMQQQQKRLSKTYIIKSEQMAIIQAFTALWTIKFEQMVVILNVCIKGIFKPSWTKLGSALA